MNATKKKTINVEIAEDAHRAARHRSLDSGETLGEIVTVALRAFLAESNSSAPTQPISGEPFGRRGPVTPAARRNEGNESEGTKR